VCVASLRSALRCSCLRLHSTRPWDASGHPCLANYASRVAHHLQRLLPSSAGTPSRGSNQETSASSCDGGGSTNKIRPLDPIRSKRRKTSRESLKRGTTIRHAQSAPAPATHFLSRGALIVPRSSTQEAELRERDRNSQRQPTLLFVREAECASDNPESPPGPWLPRASISACLAASFAERSPRGVGKDPGGRFNGL
jgi:hypothetical protein